MNARLSELTAAKEALEAKLERLKKGTAKAELKEGDGRQALAIHRCEKQIQQVKGEIIEEEKAAKASPKN